MGYNRVLNDHTLGLSVCVCVWQKTRKRIKSLWKVQHKHIYFFIEASHDSGKILENTKG